MKINDLTSQVGKLMRKENQSLQKPSNPNDKANKGDSLEISADAKKVEALVEKAVNATRENDRVAAIKEQIAKGTYEMDSKLLAEKMLKNE